MLELLLIACIICYITDISGITDTLKHLFWNWVFKDKTHYNYFAWEDVHPLLKILECSTCQVWWASLIYIIATNHFTIPYIAFSALLSLLASNISDLLRWVKEALLSLQIILNNLLKY